MPIPFLIEKSTDPLLTLLVINSNNFSPPYSSIKYVTSIPDWSYCSVTSVPERCFQSLLLSRDDMGNKFPFSAADSTLYLARFSPVLLY